MKSFIFNIKTYKMKKILIALFLIFHITCFSQNGTDNYYSGEWTPMAAKGYKFKYLRSDSGASIRAKLFVYDSTFLKGRAYANVLPATSDSSSQIANTEWVKKVIKDLGIYNIESDHVSGLGCVHIDSVGPHDFTILIDSACFKATYGVTLSKRSDSVFVTQHGVETFAFLDSSGGGGANIYNSNGSIPNSTSRTVTIGNGSKVIMTTADVADVGLKVRATNSSYSDDDLFEVEVDNVRSFSVGTSVEINKPATFADDAYFSGKIKLGGSPGTSGQVLTSQGSGAAPIWATPSGGGSALSGNNIYVDAVNGDDATAVNGDFTKPYETLDTAITHATSGYTIIVRPGTYTNVSTTLLKDGVNWYFEPGTIVVAKSTVDHAMFFDQSADVVATIAGYGKFYDTLGGASKIIELGGSGSHVLFECQSMTVGDGDQDVAVIISAGYLKVLCHGTIESKTYDAVDINGGFAIIEADELLSTGPDEGNGFEISDGTAYVKARSIKSVGAYDLFGSSSAIAIVGGISEINADVISVQSNAVCLYGNTTSKTTLRGRLESEAQAAVFFPETTTNKSLFNYATLVAPSGKFSIESPDSQIVTCYAAYASRSVDSSITVQGSLTVGSYVE